MPAIRAPPTRRSWAFYAAGLSQAVQLPARQPAKKGLEYFAELNKAGNFVPVIGKAGTLAQGATPSS